MAFFPVAAASVLGSVNGLSDGALEERVKRLVRIERRALTFLLAHLGEFDRRRLYLERGHSSLFSYCTRVLGYSEQAAYKRIQAARSARSHPIVLERISSGATTLTAAVILGPHLTEDNASSLLDSAKGMRSRDIELLAASLAPRQAVPDLLRTLPAPPTADASKTARGPGAEPWRHAPSEPRPLSADQHLFRFTGDSAFRASFERARDCLDVASMERVFAAALEALLELKDPLRRQARREARGKHSRPNSTDAGSRGRRIPAALRDSVWKRDEGRCTFFSADGQRCQATRHLEIDHIKPYALGGPSNDASNLRLLCRAHNQHLARQQFGAARQPPEGDYP